jgi:hypothetical protein
MKRLIFILLLLQYSLHTSAQNCNCRTNFDTLYKIVTEDYAGFRDLITAKNRQRYLQFTDSIRTASLTADSISCYYLLKQWLYFFDDFHLGVYINYSEGMYPRFKEEFRKIPSVEMDSARFDAYLRKGKKDFIEGRWRTRSGRTVIGVMREKPGGNTFVGFVLSSGNWFWDKKQIRFRIRKIADRKYETITAYEEDGFAFRRNIYIEDDCFYFKNDNVYERLQQPATPVAEDQFLPQLKSLSHTTLLLRLPSFNREYRPIIDSLILANRTRIESTPNLIIDLRHNDGGTVLCTYKILPYLYTKPYNTLSGSILAGEKNLALIKKYAADTTIDIESRQTYIDAAAAMQRSPGQWVELYKSTTKTFDTIFQNPRRVAIITNHNVVSAGELFLFEARQSRKVTVFGAPTYGAVDYTELSGYRLLPCAHHYYYYPTVRVSSADTNPSHATGIKPDITIGTQIKDWVKYVQQWIEKQR